MTFLNERICFLADFYYNVLKHGACAAQTRQIRSKITRIRYEMAL